MRLRGGLAFLACALSGAILRPASAQELQPPPVQDDGQVLTAAEAFARDLQIYIQAGDAAKAMALLESRPDILARPDAKRLYAELLKVSGHERDAIALLESHLTEAPDDAIARFQLAEIHFAARRDQAAELAYRMALSGNLDQGRQQVSQVRLGQIADRRDWRFWIGASVAPDSNINAATDATRVDLFGLPFDLDDAARRQSGVTFSAFSGIERVFRFAPDFALRAGAVGSVVDAPGAEFDQASLGLKAGPEWRLGGAATLSVQASGSESWFGGEERERRGGLITEFDIPLGLERWSGAVEGYQIDDLQSDARDGWTAGAEIVRTRYLGPSSLWRLGVGYVHRDAEAPSEGYEQLRASAGYLMPMPFSVLVYVEPYASTRHYAGASFAFGETREDTEFGASARFSKRDWVIAGAFPFVALSVADNDSNISLYDFKRTRVEVGFTREF